jgi:electron transfer flavoprotein alpha subunit
MAKIVVNQKLVTKQIAEDLINICPFGAFEVVNDELIINAACKTCKICVKRGPKDVCTFVEEEIVSKVDKSEWVGVAVYIEHDEDRVHPVSFELIGKAKELAKVTNHPVYAVLIGHQTEKFHQDILSFGVNKLFVYEHELFQHFNVERYTNAFEDFVCNIKPSTILFGGTSLGRSFAPRVAARYWTGLTADCTMLDMKPNTDLIQIRPAFGGNVMAQIICPNHRPQMATVRYKIFKMPQRQEIIGTIEHRPLDYVKLDSNIKVISIEEKEATMDISEAEVIIACGRPFKTKESLEMAYELADLLGGKVAVTRPLIEAGLVDPRRQIGLSGRTVAPKLIINLGISGAVQYTAGMNGSEQIITINSDPHASIFDISHYGIVGDIFKIVPKLIEQIKKGQTIY